jgi:predicted MFS family arabinose efflux permease
MKTSSTTPSGADASVAYRRYVLFVMALVSVLNMADRQVISILIEPIKAELELSDTQMGALTGLSFALFHTFACIPIALWADRWVRTSIIALGVGAWSLLTMLTGVARSFATLFAIRVGVGVGEATGAAPTHSLVSDYFPPERRAWALSILIVGAPVGSMLAFLGGGWISELFGWRAVFFVFGAAGLVVAPLVYFTVREPTRGQRETQATDTDAPPLREGLAYLLTLPSFRHVLIASGLNATANYTFLIWAAPFLMRVHGMGTGEAGTYLALGFSVANGIGVLVGGRATDRLGMRDSRWIIWAPVISSLLAAPFAWGFVLSPVLWIAIPCLAAAGLVNAVYLGPIYAAGQNLSKPGVRALASALIQLANTTLGLGIGPLLVGWLNDVGHARFGEDAIRYSITLMLFAHWWAALHLVAAARTYAADLPGAATRDTAGANRPPL